MLEPHWRVLNARARPALAESAAKNPRAPTVHPRSSGLEREKHWNEQPLDLLVPLASCWEILQYQERAEPLAASRVRH